MSKPRLIYCCQSNASTAKMRVSAALAGELALGFDVTVMLDEGSDVSCRSLAGTRSVILPGVPGVMQGSAQQNRDSHRYHRAVNSRRRVMLEALEELQPSVVVVEEFPFNQRSVEDAMLPFLERAGTSMFAGAIVVGVTDGICFDESVHSSRSLRSSADLLDQYFDLLIVRSDPLFSRVDEFFLQSNTLTIPQYHTGFVNPCGVESITPREDPGRKILVRADTSECGMALLNAAIEAQRLLWPMLQLPMRILPGPGQCNGSLRALRLHANGRAGLEVAHSPHICATELSDTRCMISCCDYDTAVTSFSSRVPTLFVPCDGEANTDQAVRAKRLVRWGLGRVLMPELLNAASLAIEIRDLLDFRPRRVFFDLNGARNAATLIARVLHRTREDSAGDGARLDESMWPRG